MKKPAIIGILFVSLMLTLLTAQYFFCTVYKFAEPAPFAGSLFYNPYAQMDAKNWVKCNLHAHVRRWGGITNGKGTANDVKEVYEALGYGVYGISDYEASDAERTLPIDLSNLYEHGYNYGKVHQLVVCASQIVYTDWLFPQTIHNKQHTLDKLSADTDALIIINHPGLRQGYNTFDAARLTGYSCMEVLNPKSQSDTVWEAALTAGRPIFIVGNDDVHNIFDSTQAGRMCTVINVPLINKSNIVTALKTGKSYGLWVDSATVLKRRRGEKIELPTLETFKLVNNQVEAVFSEAATNLAFLGENGKVLQQVNDTSIISYSIKPTDPYVRAVATFKTGTKIYLNPVFRTPDGLIPVTKAEKNKTATFFLSAAGVILLGAWFYAARKMIGSFKAKPSKD